MRRIKKTFIYSEVKVLDRKTREVLLSDKREGKHTVDSVALDYIKEKGYNPNLEISVVEVEKTFTQSAETFMKYGEEIIAEQTVVEVNPTSDEKVGN